MEKEYLLGVDVGTTSIKVAIIDKNAKLLGISSSSYPLITPNQDYVHIDTEGMWQAYLKCIRLLLQGKGISPEKIAGIGISSLCPGLAAMDEKKYFSRAYYLFRQTKHRRSRNNKSSSGGEKLFDITTKQLYGRSTFGTSMLWIKRNLPEIYEKTKYFGHINLFWHRK